MEDEKVLRMDQMENFIRARDYIKRSTVFEASMLIELILLRHPLVFLNQESKNLDDIKNVCINGQAILLSLLDLEKGE